MRKNKRRKPMGEINVVPYIDVTLVLLIIFMITTPMLQTGVDVDLPKAESANVEQKEGGKPPIIISIDKDKNFFIEADNGSEPIKVMPDEIDEKVTEIIAKNNNPQVFIRADKNVDYGSVVTVMASLKNAGIPNVGLMTQPEDN
ncbi:MAG: protein TolR [Methylococcaceae bacterium]|jgi:biopolymer transport protein TolR|nr:protein TolR [Methylococcaceae bacterium]